MKMLKRQDTRIIFEVFAGMLFSVVFSFLLISIGYFTIQMNSTSDFNVSILGLTIYEIRNYGEEGRSIISNMMYLGVIFSILFVVITEIIIGKKSRRG